MYAGRCDVYERPVWFGVYTWSLSSPLGWTVVSWPILNNILLINPSAFPHTRVFTREMRRNHEKEYFLVTLKEEMRLKNWTGALEQVLMNETWTCLAPTYTQSCKILVPYCPQLNCTVLSDVRSTCHIQSSDMYYCMHDSHNILLT